MGILTTSKSKTLVGPNDTQYPIGFDLYLRGDDLDIYSPSELLEGLFSSMDTVFDDPKDLAFHVRGCILSYLKTFISCEYKLTIHDHLRLYSYETQGRLTKTSTK